MLIRESMESLEEHILSKYAALSSRTRGRQYPIKPCDVRTDFQRDRDRIIHCKAFRRLKHKTQVFLAPQGDHYRTRLTHTLEVAQIARTMARALRLNEDLTEAIALGHDLGHTPFGHCGEKALNEILPNGFKHNVQSLRVVEVLEGRENKGLNLVWEVRDGILNHTKSGIPHTMEGKLVSLADRIAYINHDIDDAVRAGIIEEDDLPRYCIKVLGVSHGERINTMITDIIANSLDKPEISMTEEVAHATHRLREFMFENVYINSIAKAEEKKAQNLIIQLYDFFMGHPEKLPQDMKGLLENFDLSQVVCDYIAGMTDRYAIEKYRKIFIPSPWNRY
ncbi:MAG: deoxyguanosinetriphosphate triphosphohydrolase [Mahellales bacterium]|jgi:dGTPase